jgi:hypothetical protein
VHGDEHQSNPEEERVLLILGGDADARANADCRGGTGRQAFAQGSQRKWKRERGPEQGRGVGVAGSRVVEQRADRGDRGCREQRWRIAGDRRTVVYAIATVPAAMRRLGSRCSSNSTAGDGSCNETPMLPATLGYKCGR